MIKKYKGYTIEVVRDKCLGGWLMLYTTITRDSDGFICDEFIEDTEDTVRNQIKYMIQRIDAEHETDDPWEEKKILKLGE